MAWLIARIIDLFNALASWYYRRKYGAAARQLGRAVHEEADGRRGLIALEIDGLAFDYMRQALSQGMMPALLRLLRSRAMRLVSWRCGLPCTTPASQAGILYGNNWDIPGFRWYDKASGASIVCKAPGTVRAIQDRVSAGRVGLLRGGSSYTNMFDGDARLSLFTLASLGGERFFENVRGLGFLLLFALDLPSLVRVLFLSLWTWLVHVGRRLAALLRPARRHFTFLGPLFEVANNIIFREVTTFSVMLDIYRGMPVIYASYTGYDEIAHNAGADSREAFRALRGLDHQIGKIDRMRRRGGRREYDLYILSDHGMTPARPFHRLYGQTLQQFIAALTGQEVGGDGTGANSESLAAARVRSLADEIQHVEARQRGQLRALLLREARRRLEEQVLADLLEAEWDLSRRADIAVRNSGPLSHVYLNVTPRAMDLSEVALLYPGLIDALVGHEGIGLVAGREGEAVVLVGRGGTRWLDLDGERLEGDDPLAGLPDPQWAAAELRRLACFPHSGDLVLLGAWHDDHVITFEDQLATHGGLGGPQTRPFLAFSSDAPIEVEGIVGAEEVYARLAGAYQPDANL